jgi:hypothetical protein
MHRRVALGPSFALAFGMFSLPYVADAETRETGKIWRIGYISCTSSLSDFQIRNPCLH